MCVCVCVCVKVFLVFLLFVSLFLFSLLFCFVLLLLFRFSSFLGIRQIIKKKIEVTYVELFLRNIFFFCCIKNSTQFVFSIHKKEFFGFFFYLPFSSIIFKLLFFYVIFSFFINFHIFP